MNLSRELFSSVVRTWIAFLAAGTFFAMMVPMGEGFDEPWHFSYIQQIAQQRQLPRGHSSKISKEVDFFIHTHPIAWGLHESHPNLISYDEYWSARISEESERLLQSLRFSGEFVDSDTEMSTQYEGHQPPLYYFISAPVFAIAARLFSFMDTFLVLRLFSVVLSSFVVAPALFLAYTIFRDNTAASKVGALLVLFPGIYPSVARVSNDALVIPLACGALLFLVLFLQKQEGTFGVRHIKLIKQVPDPFLGLCAFVVAGLWTKAFFISIVAGILLVMAIYRQFKPAAILMLVSVLGWPWYVYNFFQTGSFTGLPETIATNTSVLASTRLFSVLDWRNVFSVVTGSHIWIGNWSFISVRSWMYRVVLWLFVLGILGLLRHGRRSLRPVLPLIVVYITFGAGLAYYAIQVFQATGLSVAQGWYLSSFVPVEALLFVAGCRSWFAQRWRPAVIFAQIVLTLLLVYSAAFVEMPYYAGMTAHKPDGHLAAYVPHLGDFGIISARPLRFYPHVPTFFPWILLLGVIGFALDSVARRNGDPSRKPRP